MSTTSFLFLTFILATMACSTPHQSERDFALLAPHGGILLKGERYHIELVQKNGEVAIYTLQELEAGAMKLLPTRTSKVYARYSPKKSKANWGMRLRQEDARYIGELDHTNNGDYKIFLDLNVNGEKEKFIHYMVVDN